MKTRRRRVGEAADRLQSSAVLPIEDLLELVLADHPSAVAGSPELQDIAESVRRFRVKGKRMVVLGGGTGMSTIVGGNSQSAGWMSRPFAGLKSEFGRLDVIACTTDDGGSTGELLKCLPMIGIGDLRKSCVSLIHADNLQRQYGIAYHESVRVARVIHRIFSFRFPARNPDRKILRNPIECVQRSTRVHCPERLAAGLRLLGEYMSGIVERLGMKLAGHSLGNLLLTASILREARGRCIRPPNAHELQKGLDHVARLIGAPPGCLHAATHVPGQLRFRYANGVEVYGQSKAGRARRDVPVERVGATYAGTPVVSRSVVSVIRGADVIIYAPGSLYSSMIPVLQLPEIVSAIRANRRAYKILAANFWIQEGETDISPGDQARGFYVSDLLEAYNRNIPGGAKGLFDVVLCSNLEHLPGNILRNYALEGKRPIHLNRAHVEAMGFLPVEATLFSSENLTHAGVIHHDAARFAMAVRAFMYLREHRKALRGWTAEHKRTDRLRFRPGKAADGLMTNGIVLSNYMAGIERVLKGKHFSPATLQDLILNLAWENRDIQASHLSSFASVKVIPERAWSRSIEWDNVLGYYDPETRSIKLHAQLLRDTERLRRDLLIALGESLLGRYIESRRWIDEREGARSYEIRLRAIKDRACFLNDRDLRCYLQLARMVPDRNDTNRFRITVNDDEGFLPPGLLFGLLYAWYLNNTYGGVMEYEMSLLRWPEDRLVPYQAKEKRRKDELVRFFRTVVFRHNQDMAGGKNA